MSKASAVQGAEQPRLEAQLHRLERLAELGLLVVGLLQRAYGALAEGRPRTWGLAALGRSDLFSLFHRAARAVRLAVALHARLTQERSQPTAISPAAAGLAQAGAGDAAHLEFDGHGPAGLREAYDRMDSLDAPEFSQAFLDRPVEELIALICRDLGLDPESLGPAGDGGGPHDMADAAAAVERLAARVLARPKPRPPSAGRATLPGLRPQPPAAASP